MEWKDQQVAHRLFGAGTVIGLENGVMEIAFAAGEKKFAYPSAFERFLTAEDAAAQQTAQADLAVQQAERAALRAERERQQAEELASRRAAHAALRRTTKRTAARRTTKKV